MTLPYKQGTPLNIIIGDGWSRGFKVEQTVNEAKLMGYDVNIEYVRDMFIEEDTKYHNHNKSQLNKEG